MINELIVLFGIKDFHECRRRIAAEVHAHLVNFIEQEDWIDNASRLHALHDLARESANIGSAVAADLGFITNPAY